MTTFTGNVNLLVAAPMLQDAFIDKDGTAMAGGTVTCYHDNSRTTLKNWYYQTGTPGAYTYTALSNPLTLSSAGSICDINGVDTIPFFYPVSELDENQRDPYYITIVNRALTNQITRENFPFQGSGGGGTSMVTNYDNLIVNSGFWRNYAPNTLNVTPYTTINLNSIIVANPNNANLLGAVVAPSQHDGFKLPDIQFIKTTNTATDTLTFVPFPLTINQPIPNFIVPEYYVNHVCSSGGSGDTQKCYQFPISLHLNTLADVNFTCSIQAQNGSTSSSAIITLFILQDTGSGTTPPAPVEIGQITLNSSWTNYTFTGTFASTSGLVLGTGADDAWYLQVQMPLGVLCNVNFTKPSIFLTNNAIPSNDFQTYDQVDSIINSPRTGDIRTAINNHYYWGWVPMNNGTIGTAASNATARNNADTWKLFNLMWQNFSALTTNGNPLIPIYTSAGSPSSYGASSYSDWSANKAIALPLMMGQVILGTVPLATLITSYASAFTSSSNVITTSNNMSFFNGMPIVFTGTSHLLTNRVYYVSQFNGTNQFSVSNTFALAIAGTTITFTNDSGTVLSSPAPSYEGEYAHTQLVAELAQHSHAAASGNFITSNSFTTAVTPGGADVFNRQETNTANTGSNVAFNVTQPGTFYNIYMKL